MTRSPEAEKPATDPVLPLFFPEASDLVITCLEQIGVDHVFGVPGGAIEPLYNALARSQRRGQITPVVARHESGAVFMADGYARDSGRLGVACTTTGPGVTNAITGIASAFQDEIPLLVLTAQTPLESFGRGAVQESSCTAVDTVGLLAHCTHYSTLVSHPAQLERKLLTALATAFEARGPVHLSIPLDLLRAPFRARMPASSLVARIGSRRVIDPEAVARLAGWLGQARRPVIVVGEGCRGNTAPLVEIAERLGALLVATPQGKGLVDPYHPNFRGICGLAGHTEAREAILDPEADLVVVVGSLLDDQAGQGWLHEPSLRDGRLVHVDALARHFTRSPHAGLHVLGEPEDVFRQLRAALPAAGMPAPWDQRQTGREAAGNVVPFERRRGDRRARAATGLRGPERRQADRRVAPGEPRLRRAFSVADEHHYAADAGGPVRPQHLMHELSRLLPPGTRYLADIGNSFLWAIHYLHPAQEAGGPVDYFRTSMGFASMGWAIGAAVGTALSDRSRPVVCLVGDGSFLMSGQELTAAIAHEAPVLFVVLNDQALGTVRHGQSLAGAEPIGFELPPVDYAAMARAMGAAGHPVATAADLRQLDLRAVFRRPGPTLIDVRIDAGEAPPLLERLDMLATS